MKRFVFVLLLLAVAQLPAHAQYRRPCPRPVAVIVWPRSPIVVVAPRPPLVAVVIGQPAQPPPVVVVTPPCQSGCPCGCIVSAPCTCPKK